MTFTRGVAQFMRGPVSCAVRLRNTVGRYVSALRTWAWLRLLTQCVLGAFGLVVLAMIGHSALAGASAASAVSQPASTEGSAPLSIPPPSSLASAVADAAAPALATTTHVPPTVPTPPPSRRATPDDPVLLNSAGAEDLRRLPGVGAKRALLILALRDRLGRFHQVEDLLRVKGIGRATLKKLRPLVRLDAPP